MILLFLNSCSIWEIARTGTSFPSCSHERLLENAKFTPEKAFVILQKKYKLTGCVYYCFFDEDKYFFSPMRKITWPKIGYWFDPVSGDCGLKNANYESFKKGIYSVIEFEWKNENTYTYSHQNIKIGL